MKSRATTLEHVGEWRVAIDADSIEELLIELARAIARFAGKTTSAPGEWEPVTVKSRDTATLLVDWANELLGRSEIAGRAYSEARDVRIRQLPDRKCVLTAEVRGHPVTQWASPLKAATYYGLSLQKSNGEWHAVMLFDV
jgi:protein archease